MVSVHLVLAVAALPTRATPQLHLAVDRFTDLRGDNLGSADAAEFIDRVGPEVAAVLARTGRYRVSAVSSSPPGESPLAIASKDGADLLLTGAVVSAAFDRKGGGRVHGEEDRRVGLWVGTIELDVRLIEVASGRDLWRGSSEGSASRVAAANAGGNAAGRDEIAELLLAAVPKAAQALARDLLPLLDRLQTGDGDAVTLTADAALRDGMVYLAAGSDLGIRQGDRFALFVPGESFTVGDETVRDETPVGTLLVTTVRDKYARGGAPDKLLALPTPPAGKIIARRQAPSTRSTRPTEPEPIATASAPALPREPRLPPVEPSPPSTREADSSPTASGARQPALAGKTRGRVGGQAARLRAGPGTDFVIRGVLAPGSPLETVRADGDWVLVRNDAEGEGWVFASLLEQAPPEVPRSPGTPGVAPAETTPKPGTTSSEASWSVGRDAARLRGGPDTGEPILAVLPPGTQVTLLESRQDWSEVRTPSGQQGWVYSPLLRPPRE